ncbi:DUF3565 domain-containing protein [Archangium sp.]|uniref:DUF3565 domain-containing protein n=1 Tax=Archangium sp. TaxID=1872627 RepID=UPI002D38685C|nr:DUF3565 domain-containing protein [Archangium sp.]HYO53938.1 DUF3565 domain-containing protein [Archangium sp.]
MKQAITGFHLDSENHQVAELACGHWQHLRHDPPWRERPLGIELECERCDEVGRAVAEAVREALVSAARQAYEEGGLSGLCSEGRWELALDTIRAADLTPTIRRTLAQERQEG